MKPLDVAVKAALSAGELILSSYGKLKNSEIRVKSKNDFVTEVDKKSEALILSEIKQYFPRAGIQAEESGLARGDGMLWIIDPLDGTANYIHQFPLFSISIGMMEDGVLKTGVVYDPLHREMFTAEKGRGAFLNKKPARVSKTALLADALMTTGIPFRARERFDGYMASFKTISLASAGMRRGGSAALDLAYVACGRFDGFWEINLSPWDIAAGALLIEEAGGRISDLWGHPDYLKNGDVLASNGLIHAELGQITRALEEKRREE
ncbi:MAG: inositol monophosphatase [Candidatus Omnitrophica bacterium]|nr:inositol monophosphatase [Candidatus Omnitrophota bacterium]